MSRRQAISFSLIGEMTAQSTMWESCGEMREWNGLYRGGQLWGCLQTAELSSREQLYLRLRG